jgi:hypothetical protein
MKQLFLFFLLSLSLASFAQTGYPSPRPAGPRSTTSPPAASPKVYVCGGGSAYAYHRSEGCAGLNRCSHGVSPVTVAEAESMSRRPCKKCY